MPLSSDEITNYILQAIPDAEINLRDIAGDGNHYSLEVSSSQFKGLSRVQQHQLIYQALQGKMGNELHALAINTKTK